MTRYRLVVFDLDGTLIDSKGDVAAALNAALADVSLPPYTPQAVERMMGEGARLLVEKAIARRLPPDRTEMVLGRYLTHYNKAPTAHTRLYPGVHEGLRRIGARRMVATNKPGPLARTIVRSLNLGALIERVYGEGDVRARKPDPAMLEQAMASAGAGRAETLFVGDSRVDAEAARAAGVPLCLVGWGYGSALVTGATYRVRSFDEIVKLVEGV